MCHSLPLCQRKASRKWKGTWALPCPLGPGCQCLRTAVAFVPPPPAGSVGSPATTSFPGGSEHLPGMGPGGQTSPGSLGRRREPGARGRRPWASARRPPPSPPAARGRALAPARPFLGSPAAAGGGAGHRRSSRGEAHLGQRLLLLGVQVADPAAHRGSGSGRGGCRSRWSTDAFSAAAAAGVESQLFARAACDGQAPASKESQGAERSDAPGAGASEAGPLRPPEAETWAEVVRASATTRGRGRWTAVGQEVWVAVPNLPLALGVTLEETPEPSGPCDRI